MGEEIKKVGGNGKRLLPKCLAVPAYILVFGLILLLVGGTFLLALIVGAIVFSLWAILHPRRAPEKFLEILVTLGDLRENTKEKLRPWRW